MINLHFKEHFQLSGYTPAFEHCNNYTKLNHSVALLVDYMKVEGLT